MEHKSRVLCTFWYRGSFFFAKFMEGLEFGCYNETHEGGWPENEKI